MNTLRLEPCIELPLSTDIFSETVAKAKDYTLMHGKKKNNHYISNEENRSSLRSCLSETKNTWNVAFFTGVSMHSKLPFDRDRVTIVPFVLLPSSFPTTEFNKAIKIQTIFNALIHKVAHDHEFLSENLK